jgi:hypothetical protein
MSPYVEAARESRYASLLGGRSDPEWFDSWSHSSFLRERNVSDASLLPIHRYPNSLVIVPALERDALWVELALIVDDNLLALFTDNCNA